MSFVSGFYSFIVDLVHSDSDQYASLRFKVARHPEETTEYLIGRVFAYLHSYEPDLQFSRGLFEPKEPTIWKHSVTEELVVWTEVGLPGREKIERVLRHHPKTKLRVYFCEEDEIKGFCHYLRGSKTNWVEKIEFYVLDHSMLSSVGEHLESSNRWQVTISGGEIFLTLGENTYESAVKSVDIWDAYQETLKAND